MPTKTVREYVELDVHFELDDFETDDLIEELEDRGLNVLDKEDSGSMSDAAKDEIYDLYRDYISGNDFERKLKVFFEGQLGFIVH
jgi:hypothetical protein